jgi:dinuclear metal center YbgI/SA1388 family protein
MAKVALATITTYCDKILHRENLGDYEKAFNGLQVQNRGFISRIGATVDASLATTRLAAKQKVDFLLVHHGLFWTPMHPWTARRYELLRTLLDNDIAIYSSHLPLDAHKKFGNNAVLAGVLGFRNLKPFFQSHGDFIGCQSLANVKRDELTLRVQRVTGTPVRLLPGGPPVCRRIGIVTGGAGADLSKAAREGVDTFITGEGPHWTFAQAEDLGINVFYAGHYATETFGVKALAAHLSKRFKLPWVFLDHPTGL